MNFSKSIDFLIENAEDVIQYRLHKEKQKDAVMIEFGMPTLIETAGISDCAALCAQLKFN